MGVGVGFLPLESIQLGRGKVWRGEREWERDTSTTPQTAVQPQHVVTVDMELDVQQNRYQ